MGTFGGHALPGSFFILISIWHAVNLFRRYFRSKKPGQKPFQTALYFPAPCLRTVPLEPIFILFMTTVGNVGELITAFRGGHFVNIGNGQHIIMFSCFGLTGFMEILHHYGVNLPPNLLYLCSIFAVLVEALLFYWHLHISEPMEMQVHTLLLYVLVATVICLAVEMQKQHSIAPAFCRVYLIFLQGIWFWQVGFILYPPLGMKSWDWSNHQQMMIVTIIFCLHCGLSFVVMMFLWFVIAAKFGYCRKDETSSSNNGYVNVPYVEELDGCEERLILVDNNMNSKNFDGAKICDY